jgi:hypothetical protein
MAGILPLVGQDPGVGLRADDRLRTEREGIIRQPDLDIFLMNLYMSASVLYLSVLKSPPVYPPKNMACRWTESSCSVP